MAISTRFFQPLRRLSSLVEPQSLKYTHLYNPKITPPPQAWVENFIGRERELLGIVDLHPRIFSIFPRMDWVSRAVKWQQNYREIDYTSMPTRNELTGGKERPWPQKGMGKARHKTRNSPLWIKGGWAKGPRGPVTSFRFLPHFDMVNGLKAMLTIKLHQNDLKIVDSIEDYYSEDHELFEDEMSKRNWGPSVLIVDKCENFPTSLVNVTSNLNHVNLMHTQGLNTLSMCKHETMVVTLRAIREIEDKLLFQLVRVDLSNTHQKYRDE